MSIKTTKRLALGVIASLVFAPFAAIAPASAAEVGVAGISITTPTLTVNVGTVATTTFSLDPSAALANTESIAITPTVTVPTASVITIARKSSAAINAGTTEILVNTGEAFSNATAAVANTTSVYTLSASGATEAVSTVAGTISFTPDAPGTYVVTLTTAAAGTNTVKTASFTVTARSLSYTTGDGSPVAPFSTGKGVAGVANTVTVTAYSTQTASQKALVTVSGADAKIQSASNATVSADFASAVVNAASNSAVVIKTPSAGTVTVNLFNETAAGSGLYSTTAANTVTITVAAAAITGVLSTSTVYMNTSNTTPDATSDAATTTTAPLAAANATAGTPIANILVTQLDGQATPVNVPNANTKAVVYEISGAGALGTSGTASIGSYIAVAAASANANRVYIHPDGRTGVGTITVKVNGVLVSTKTVKFYGAVASYTLVTKNAVLAVGSTADIQVLTVQALDASGVARPSDTVYVSSGTTTVATVDTATVTTGATGLAADIGVNGVKIGSAVITVANAATPTTSGYVSATATISVVAAGVSSVALSFDKTSYLPGEKATLSITLKNADAALVGDQDYADVFATGGITASANLTTTLTATAATTVNGVKAFTIYMPLTEGPVSVEATIGAGATIATAIRATKVSASTTVAKPVVPVVVPPVVYDNPTLSFVKSKGRIILSGTAVNGEGDIIIYVKKVGTTAWKERAKTLEVAAPGDFNGSIKAPKANVLMRVKQEGTGQFSNQIIVVK